ncbi:MAG: molecular chaperone DnaJ [Agathobacter sp.]|nr:molecular chaperone DnaJ [Agathobacter sp.]
MTLEEERRALDEQRRSLERERREFTRRVEIEDRRLEQQQQLFEMKFKILEEELQKLATEKAHVEKQKAFYSRVTDYETNCRASERAVKESNIVKGELFFSGVGSKQSLKKRYKDLIKIYHPDNLDGDTDTIQEINSEYNKLCALYEV